MSDDTIINMHINTGLNDMTQRAHTTTIFVDTKDYIAADLDDGGVRIGLYGRTCFELPATHDLYNAVKECKTSDDVEEIFDTMMDRK